MPYKSSNLPFNLFYSAMGGENLSIEKANDSANSFFSSMNPLMFRIIKRDVYSKKISNISNKYFTGIRFTSEIRLKMFKNFSQ